MKGELSYLIKNNLESFLKKFEKPSNKRERKIDEEEEEIEEITAWLGYPK